jgi:hypothetical protein
LSCLVWSGLVWAGLVWSGLVWSGLVWSGLVCEIASMDLSDVERLDCVLAEGECWHGCILCPGVGDGEPYNLLVQGTVVKFYKSKTGNLQSRQATAGIMIPTAYPVTVEEWPRVLIQLEQWAFEGNSPIASHSDKGATRQCLLNKLLQCPRGVMYRPKVPQQFDGNGLREGIRLNGIRQQHNNQKITLHKRSKAVCEPSQRPSKRVISSKTERGHKDVISTSTLRKTRSCPLAVSSYI